MPLFSISPIPGGLSIGLDQVGQGINLNIIGPGRNSEDGAGTGVVFSQPGWQLRPELVCWAENSGILIRLCVHHGRHIYGAEIEWGGGVVKCPVLAATMTIGGGIKRGYESMLNY